MEDGDTRIRATGRAGETVDTVYRNQSRSVLATLIRLVGDFDLAEEAAQEFALFSIVLPVVGRSVPVNPRASIISTARHKAIDRIRRRARLEKNAFVRVAPPG